MKHDLPDLEWEREPTGIECVDRLVAASVLGSIPLGKDFKKTIEVEIDRETQMVHIRMQILLVVQVKREREGEG